MVRKTIKAITGKISGLYEAALWLSLFTFFSQLLAFLRDRLLAHNFGVGEQLDMYYAAFKFPDLIFVTVASLVSISALVPLFAKKETEGEKHLKQATESIFSVFSLMMIISCILAFFLTPFIIKFFFSGFSPLVINKTIFLSRILILSPLLLGFSNFFGSIVQYEKRFILYSLSPILYNFGIILGALFLSNSMGILGIVIGVVFGASMHLAIQASFVWGSLLKPKITFDIKWEDVFETLKLSVPRTLALSVMSFVVFFFTSLASRFNPGSIAVFNFSSNLQSVPLSLIGVSFSLAAFPGLAVSAAKNNKSEIITKISEGLRQIIFWSLPLSFLFIILRAHIVRLILGSGVFDWSATRLTAAALAIFVASSVFQSIQLFLSRSHYALGKTKWPFWGNVFGGIISIFSALIFFWNFSKFKPFFDLVSKLLKIQDLPFEVITLPLAFSLGSTVTALVLFFALGRDFYLEIWRQIRVSVSKSFIGGLSCGIGAYIGLAIFDSFFSLHTFSGVLLHALFSGILGVCLGALVFRLLGDEEYIRLVSRIKNESR